MRLEQRVKEHIAEFKHLIKESISGRTGSRVSRTHCHIDIT
jgi:hypothetical protein